MSRIIEGYWDCPYCNSKGIRGREQVCPNCGRTRDGSTKFYMKDKETYHDQSVASRGPDWYCDYCGSYNPDTASVCVGCGSERTKKIYKTREYLSSEIPTNGNSEQKTWIDADIDKDANDEPNISSDKEMHEIKTPFQRFSSSKITKYVALALAVILIITGLIVLLIPKTKTINVTAKNWEYDIVIEENKLVTEDDWSVPADAVEVISQKKEIHHYNHVLDHYETVEVQRSRQVFDGYDTYYSYRDNGNGFFQEIEHQTPRYRTEYYTEYEQRPVYRDDPVYQTKYYYTVWRWVYNRTETTSGVNNTPCWPEYTLSDKERVSEQNKKYSITGTVNKKEKTYTCSEELWNKIEKNSVIKVKVVLNQITELVN